MDMQQLSEEVQFLKAQVAANSGYSTGPSWDSVNALREQVETLTTELKALQKRKVATIDDLNGALARLTSKANSTAMKNAELILDVVSTEMLKTVDAEREKTGEHLRATASAAAASAREARDIAANELESAISTLKSFSYHFANSRTA